MQTPARDTKLSFGQKVAVGMGGLPLFFGHMAVKNMSLPVYHMILGINPAMLGAVLAIPRLWDAFIDPWVGNLSDNCRSRFGRRKPFIVVGALAMAASYGLIWMVSPDWTETGKLGWLLGTSIVFYGCYAIYSVPYQSLTYEASPDYDERTGVMAHTSFWYKFGESFYQWIFAISQMALFASPLLGARVMNWLVAVLILGAVGVIPGLLGRERYFRRAVTQQEARFWPGFIAALRSRPLLILMFLTALKLFAGMVASSMDYYLLVYYMFDGDVALGSYWKGILSTAYAVVGFASIPVLSWLCRLHGKKRTIMLVYGIVVIAGIVKWFVFTPGVGWWLLVDPLFSGPILVAVSMVIPSMMADVCDEDELQHGVRREGMFGAVFMWIQKSGVALAFLGTGIALNCSGFAIKLGSHQSPETFFWMRAMLAASTSVTAVTALIVAAFYPITRERAEATRRQLETRRGML